MRATPPWWLGTLPDAKMTTDLLELVECCRQGDDLAWEQLVRRCQGRVYALATTWAGSRMRGM